MGLFCFWLKCRTFSSRWRRKAEEEEREKKEKEEAQKVIARWWRRFNKLQKNQQGLKVMLLERHVARALERHRARAHARARAPWYKLIRHVQRDQRVAISWRALADGALEHKKQLEAAPFAWFEGAGKTPMLLQRITYPAKKYKALCKLRHPALARRPPGYGALLALFSQRPASMPINDTPICLTQLRRRLAVFHDNGWQAVNVGGDGNCFFRALAKQVYSDEQEHGRARQETIQYMRERREEFEHFVPKDFDSYDSYVNHMSREGTYIEGQFEIQAAADAFNVHIMVYGRSRDHDRTFTPLMSNLETRDVYMAHYQAAQHYVVLERMDPAPTARGGLSRSTLASGGLDSSNSSRARRQDSRGTPTARRLPPASARAPGEIVLEMMATPLGRPRDELDA